MKKILCLIFVMLISEGFSAVSGTTLPDGSFELSNRFLRAVINPVKGARVVQLFDRRSGVEYADGAWDLGIGGELNWQERKLTASAYYGQPYSCQLEKLPGQMVLRCERTGTGAVGQWITIHKTYTLKENSSELTLDYQIAVNSAAMTSLDFCLWLHNSAQIRNEPGEVRLAKSSGVTGIPFNAGSPLNESFHYDLADGWFAFARSNAPAGIILQVPVTDLMCFYNWQGQQGNTMEIMYRSQKIPAGKAYSTRLAMLLYDQLPPPDGAGGGLVGAFTPNGVKVYAAQDADGKLNVSFRKLPGRLETPVQTFDFSLKAGEVREFPFQVAGDNIEIIVRTSEAGKPGLVLRRPRGVKNYVRQPEIPRRGSSAERYGQVILNEADKQDCYQWHLNLPPTGKPFLKPDAAGRLKLLIVTDMKCGREVTELANRMDSEPSTCTFSSGGPMQWHPVWGHTGGHAEMNLYLGELLKKDYDVIVLGGIQIDVISKNNLAAIAGKVKQGTGLVAVMPSKIPASVQELFPARPLINECFKSVNRKISRAGNFRVAPESPVKNFPFAMLPPVYLFPYSAENAVISCGNAPFLATGKYGKGRTALFAYLTGRPDNTRRAGLTPFFAVEPDLPWHESFYGMLIQGIRWSAGRVPQVEIEHFTATSKHGALVLNNRLERKVAAKILFSARHPGRDFPEKTVEKQLVPGENRITVPLDFPFLAGNNLIEARIYVDQYALDFASAAVNADTGAHIGKITVPEKILPAGETFLLVAELNGDFDQASYQLIDPEKRILACGLLQNGQAQVKPQGVYRHRASLYVELSKNGAVRDRRKIIVDLIPETELTRSWNSYNVMISWPVRDTRAFPFFLQEIREKSLREIGINLVMAHGIPTHWGQDNAAKYGLNYRYVGQLVMESIARLNYSSNIPGFKYPAFDYRNRKAELAKILADYARTRDKYGIKRNPRLDDPEYLNAYRKALEVHLPKLSQWHPYVYDLGDEMSYGEFLRPVDFDFSPQSLQQFRIWLKERYHNDLARLNREWQRDYRIWDEVVPDTGLEARGRGVFSAWALHRIYNTTLFAGFWRLVADTARRLDPGARISASGTPAPHPYNAYDYELLLPIVGSLSAYTTYEMSELLNSFKKLPLTAWVGYSAAEKELWHSIWNNAFNGHFGVSLYSEMTLINPDLTLTEQGLAIRDALVPLRNGIGSLLFHSIRPAQAAVLYSTPSLMATWADHSVNDFDDARAAWCGILKRNQCNSRFITPGQLIKGELTSARYKVLVLPLALALSDAETRAISEFAANGGVILADLMPGKYNENVARVSPGRIQAPGMFVAGKKLHPEWSSTFMRGVEREIAARLRKAGIGGEASRLEKISGSLEINSYRLCPEGGEIFGVWSGGPGAVKLTPDNGGAVYALLAGKSAAGRFNLPADRPEVFVSLPYRVETLAAEGKLTDGELSAAGAIVSSRGTPLRHVLNFRVYDRSGQELRHLRRSVEAPAGKAATRWKLALNEKGPYRIEITDLISCVQGKAEVHP